MNESKNELFRLRIIILRTKFLGIEKLKRENNFNFWPVNSEETLFKVSKITKLLTGRSIQYSESKYHAILDRALIITDETEWI